VKVLSGQKVSGYDSQKDEHRHSLMTKRTMFGCEYRLIIIIIITTLSSS